MDKPNQYRSNHSESLGAKACSIRIVFACFCMIERASDFAIVPQPMLGDGPNPTQDQNS